MPGSNSDSQIFSGRIDTLTAAPFANPSRAPTATDGPPSSVTRPSDV